MGNGERGGTVVKEGRGDEREGKERIGDERRKGCLLLNGGLVTPLRLR